MWYAKYKHSHFMAPCQKVLVERNVTGHVKHTNGGAPTVPQQTFGKRHGREPDRQVDVAATSRGMGTRMNRTTQYA